MRTFFDYIYRSSEMSYPDPDSDTDVDITELSELFSKDGLGFHDKSVWNEIIRGEGSPNMMGRVHTPNETAKCYQHTAFGIYYSILLFFINTFYNYDTEEYKELSDCFLRKDCVNVINIDKLYSQLYIEKNHSENGTKMFVSIYQSDYGNGIVKIFPSPSERIIYDKEEDDMLMFGEADISFLSESDTIQLKLTKYLDDEEKEEDEAEEIFYLSPRDFVMKLYTGDVILYLKAIIITMKKRFNYLLNYYFLSEHVDVVTEVYDHEIELKTIHIDEHYTTFYNPSTLGVLCLITFTNFSKHVVYITMEENNYEKVLVINNDGCYENFELSNVKFSNIINIINDYLNEKYKNIKDIKMKYIKIHEKDRTFLTNNIYIYVENKYNLKLFNKTEFYTRYKVNNDNSLNINKFLELGDEIEIYEHNKDNIIYYDSRVVFTVLEEHLVDYNIDVSEFHITDFSVEKVFFIYNYSTKTVYIDIALLANILFISSRVEAIFNSLFNRIGNTYIINSNYSRSKIFFNQVL